jgi:hypothetical protein
MTIKQRLMWQLTLTWSSTEGAGVTEHDAEIDSTNAAPADRRPSLMARLDRWFSGCGMLQFNSRGCVLTALDRCGSG